MLGYVKAVVWVASMWPWAMGECQVASASFESGCGRLSVGVAKSASPPDINTVNHEWQVVDQPLAIHNIQTYNPFVQITNLPFALLYSLQALFSFTPIRFSSLLLSPPTCAGSTSSPSTFPRPTSL